MADRLSLAVEKGHVALPDAPLLVIGADAAADLAPLDRETARLMARYRDAHEATKLAGWISDPAPEGPFGGAVVFAPRSRDAQRAAIRTARASTGGPIVVDGPKTHGIDALYRELRDRAEVSPAWAKAHGKIFTVTGGDFGDWPEEAPALAPDGWWRAPGGFSEAGVDKASAYLAGLLPEAMTGAVVDLGAGWGYLARAILARDGVETVHLVENDRVSLAAAARNVTDGRAAFHWADATRWAPPGRADHVVTNPPFHAGRKAEPELGRAFIRAAAAMLTPKGGLWLVANRHLPYESALEASFREVREIGSDRAFKVFHAIRPRPENRTGKTP